MTSIRPGVEAELSTADLDPRESPTLRRAIPGLDEVFDERAMAGRLETILLGEGGSGRLERCERTQASFVPEDRFVVRYEISIRPDPDAPPVHALVNCRLFPDRESARQYDLGRLAPLAEAMAGRPEAAPFSAMAGEIPELATTVSVFPVDGELPILVRATDAATVFDLLKGAVPSVLDGSWDPEQCRIELGHYGRQHRCVLLYTLEGKDPATGEPASELVYGKLAADGRGALTPPVIDALNRQVLSRMEASFAIPRCFGWFPDLQLVLLESIAGRPQVAQLLKARVKGEGADGPLSLEDAVEHCARIAAALHTSGIELGRRRDLDDELAELRHHAGILSSSAPGLGERFGYWLGEVEDLAGDGAGGALGFSHGDFSYTQLIFDGPRPGLVDFDTMCQAEPALDLGQFLAYVRVSTLKSLKGPTPEGTELTEGLCDRFMRAYVAASDHNGADQAQILARTRVYELISLLRLSYHSWQKLKGSRLMYVSAVIEGRLAAAERAFKAP